MEAGEGKDDTQKPSRNQINVALVVAILFGMRALFDLVMGTTYGGPRYPSVSRVDDPFHYWVLLAVSAGICGYFSAVALGIVSINVVPKPGSKKLTGPQKRRRQQGLGATVLFIMWVVLVVGWVAEVSDVGMEQASPILGLAIPGLLGFIALIAPRQPGRLGSLLLGGGALLLGGALIGMLVA